MAVTFVAKMSASANLGRLIPFGMSSRVVALTHSLKVPPAALDTRSRYSYEVKGSSPEFGKVKTEGPPTYWGSSVSGLFNSLLRISYRDMIPLG